ncbi:tetratricopeptide repeat-containing sensor histidine kinase [Maribacter dokdonensis]|uniref:tetratricopeptide repeat-containing sensor histidine kinase n=1 Tax=Maribacter dokdonensis TaxID=320912 RepID=UPI0007199287|nr:tetratricopeptide repeat-containing sensor histidine kinase [Maribacter dokdonensis]KSA13938.1 Sensory box histidine kinase [Maribacter dokdonensis DSW-8]
MNKYYLSLILSCLLLSFSCSKTESAKPTIVEKQENDSISIWIDESYNANSERKLELQNKAFQLAKNTSNDTLKSKYFSNLSFNQQFLSDSLLFRKINKEAILINKQIKDSTALGYAYWDLAYFFDNHIVKDSSFYFYTEALNIFTGIGDRAIIGRMYLNMAGIQMKIKDYVGSEANTIKAIENFKIIEDNEKLYRCYNLLGIVLGDLKEFDKSLAYYNEALFYLEKTPNSTIEKASVSNNIGVNYRHLKLYDKAIHNFENVLKINNLHIKHPSLFAKAISNLATSKLYAQDTLNVENLFKKSIEIKKEENELASLSSSYFNYAEYKAYAKDTINAIEKLKKSENLARESSSNEQLLKTWQYLAILDKNNASDYFKKFTKLNDSLLFEERKQQNKFARIRFETDEFIAENIELESEKQVLSKQKQIWIGIATGFFLLGLSVYIIINQRAKNQKLRFDQQQQANNQEIFNLMLMQKQKVDEVKRLEQKRISEELHDGVLGKMLGARMILTGLNKRATDEAIQEKSKALGSLQEIENEIRAISHELSHSAYQKISNFTDSVETLLANNRNTKIKTIFHFNEDENWDSLAGEIKINVYRIIQETFQNAIKHSKCSFFEVTFYRDDEQFNVIMSDNGIGYNVNKGKKGIGIRNITSRIEKLNGSFHIDSTEGQGTTISLNIPI